MIPEQRDENLWRIARKRASFRRHFYTFIIINGFFWGIWWITVGRNSGFSGYPWPVWITLTWGIGLAFNYFNAYHGSGEDLAHEEYEKLKRDREIK